MHISSLERSQDGVRRWEVFEVELNGPSDGNPFVDVELDAVFSSGHGVSRVGGFYDGGGRYKIRFMPDEEGEWSFRTISSVPALDGIEGAFVCGAPPPNRHGPVGVADRFHFRYADGERYLPIGTTAYAWTHQPPGLQQATLGALAKSPFTKLRMCVFPKSYLFNSNEPIAYPFAGSIDTGWDLDSFNPAFFQRLENQVAALADLGIEADIILFHPYDRWGFADMGAAADDRYVRYLVRRLSSFANVWWSLANEFDLITGKRGADWDRLAGIVNENDPYRHLLSVHNGARFFDHSQPWVTHCSIQRIDWYRTSENTDEWRDRWQKPVVVDECGYEGDIDSGWGSLPAEELVRRCWEGALRGGYVGHGETYLNEREELWWSKGGELVGASPARIGFLRHITEACPGGVLEPIEQAPFADAVVGGVRGEHEVHYLGFNQPRFRMFHMPAERPFRVDVIDTWNMTVDELPDSYEGTFRIELPGRQYMAVRMRVTGPPVRTTT